MIRDYKDKRFFREDISKNKSIRYAKFVDEKHEEKVKERFYKKPYSRYKHTSLQKNVKEDKSMLRNIKKDLVEAGKLALALYAGGAIAWTSINIINTILELIF